MNIDEAGEAFIIQEETGGRGYYEKVYGCSFIWPGSSSGATALVGIDIGYYTEKEVEDIFEPLTSSQELELIQAGRGLKKLAARDYVPKLKNIVFPWEEAVSVFKKFTLPKFIKLTKYVFPGVENLSGGAQAALLSLVFNRGVSLKGPSRKEMLEIRNLVPKKDYEGIAKQIKAMKRLWSTGGLPARRDREAVLVLKAN
jgi:hypothetical protein